MSNHFPSKTKASTVVVAVLSLFLSGWSCKSVIDREDVRPRILRDVPARVLAYRLEADVAAPRQHTIDVGEKHPTIQTEFTLKRPDEALLRTVTSPDGNRVLALYATEAEPGAVFRIDLYSADGQFLRNLTPPDLSCVFPETVTWTTDSNLITFIGRKRAAPSPSPTPLPDFLQPPSSPTSTLSPSMSPSVLPSVAPSFAPVASFNTEQIYVCNRDGFDLKPLTMREGLIYFAFAWAPDNHSLVALACKEDEWDTRERQFMLPAGRPRLIGLDGKERLLDDALAEALPVWSPDSSKVATAFGTDVAIYDAVTDTPTQARLPLRDALIAASRAYDQKLSVTKEEKPANINATEAPTPASPAAEVNEIPNSFNPIVRLDWSSPEQLYFQTAYVRIHPNEVINTFQRWHLLHLSAQAAVLK